MAQVQEATQVSIASLYVGDIKPDVNEQILWNVFSPFGQILSIKICRDSQTHTSLGYGYVNFRTVGEAEKAMENVNFTLIDGRPCRVMWSMRDSNRRKLGIGNLFIKNIDPLLDSKSLYLAFSAFGPVLSCKIALDDYGCSKGYGFIQFYNEKDAENAMSRANGISFSKKKLVVTKFIPRASRVDAKPVDPNQFTNVFVKNFGPELTVDDFKKMFSKYGEITSCVIRKDENDKSLGFGFINFASCSSAAAAVKEMHEFEISSDKKLFVSKAMKKLERQAFLKKQYEQKKLEFYKQYQNLNLYIKNFDESVTDEKLVSLFSQYGTIRSAQIMKDDSGKSRGFGFVCFTTSEEAQAAIEAMHQKVIDNKPLYVAIAQNKEERKKILEQQTYNNSFRAPIFPPPSGMPFMYTHPAAMSYHPAQFARFPQPMPNRSQSRPPQPVPSGNNLQQNQQYNRQSYPHYHGANYSQPNYRSRSNAAGIRPPQQNPFPNRQHQAIQTTLNNVVTEPIQRPKREVPSKTSSSELQELQVQVFRLSKAVFAEKNFDLSLINRISGVVIDFYSKTKSVQSLVSLDDQSVSETITNAYKSFMAQNNAATSKVQ